MKISSNVVSFDVGCTFGVAILKYFPSLNSLFSPYGLSVGMLCIGIFTKVSFSKNLVSYGSLFSIFCSILGTSTFSSISTGTGATSTTGFISGATTGVTSSILGITTCCGSSSYILEVGIIVFISLLSLIFNSPFNNFSISSSVFLTVYLPFIICPNIKTCKVGSVTLKSDLACLSEILFSNNASWTSSVKFNNLTLFAIVDCLLPIFLANAS